MAEDNQCDSMHEATNLLELIELQTTLGATPYPNVFAPDVFHHALEFLKVFHLSAMCCVSLTTMFHLDT